MSRRDQIEATYLAGVVSIARIQGLEPAPLLSPETMGSKRHEEILRAITDLIGVGDTADTTAIVQRLGSTGKLALVEADYVYGLDEKHDPDARLNKLAKAIRTMHDADTLGSKLRLAQTALKAGELHKTREIAAEIALTTASEKPFEILTGRQSAEAALAMAQDDRGLRIRIGDAELEKALGTLGPGTLTVIGADTGVGKSTLALHMARTMGTRVGIVSVEDPAEVFGGKLLSHASGVDSERLFMGKADMIDLQQMRDSLHRVTENVRIAYAINSPLVDILSAIRALVNQHGCRVIVVDYVQNIRFDPKIDRRVTVADAIAQIKGLCARLGAAAVVCSQLSRPSQEVKWREPAKHHLKESGDIENMCEAIVLLWQRTQGGVVYGKVDKLKYSARRHRFRFERDTAGNLIDCVPWGGDYPEDAKDEDQPRKTWGGRRAS
jgi:replicative DNA helicase